MALDILNVNIWEISNSGIWNNLSIFLNAVAMTANFVGLLCSQHLHRKRGCRQVLHVFQQYFLNGKCLGLKKLPNIPMIYQTVQFACVTKPINIT